MTGRRGALAVPEGLEAIVGSANIGPQPALDGQLAPGAVPREGAE